MNKCVYVRTCVYCLELGGGKLLNWTGRRSGLRSHWAQSLRSTHINTYTHTRVKLVLAHGLTLPDYNVISSEVSSTLAEDMSDCNINLSKNDTLIN